MKKVLICLLCLGMIAGCSNSPNNENQSNANTQVLSEKDQLLEKLKSEPIYIGDDVKVIEETEKILIDSGYQYDVTDDNSIVLLNPYIDFANVIVFTKSDDNIMIVMDAGDENLFTYINSEIDNDTVYMADNGNIKWSLDLNERLEADTSVEETEEDLQDILDIKNSFNDWCETNNLSIYDLSYFFQLYYDTLINGYSLVEVKMPKFEE